MWNATVTNAGDALLARIIEGGRFDIVGAAAGTGRVPLVQLARSMDLAGTIHTLGIVDYYEVEQGVRFAVQISAADSAYTANQIGLWATLDGGERTLLAIYQADEGEGISVPASVDMPSFLLTFGAVVAMDNTGNLSVTISLEDVATMETLVSYANRKVDKTSIVNDLTQTEEGFVLDARQGKVLAEAIAGKANADDVYTKHEVNEALSGKADKSDTYAKNEIDEAFEQVDSNFRQVGEALQRKADADNVYTKNETIEALAGKADKNNTYTKQEVDEALDDKTERFTFTATVPDSGWEEHQSLFRVTVPVEGMLETDSCGGVGPIQSGDESADREIRKAWARIVRIAAANDGVTLYATRAPAISIPFQVEIFR